MEIISVPRTPKSAYNPNRPVSQLIRAHLHLAERAAKVPAVRRRAQAIATEGEAARYLAELTAIVHPRLAPPQTPGRPTHRKTAARKPPKSASRKARKVVRKVVRKVARKTARKPARRRARR